MLYDDHARVGATIELPIKANPLTYMNESMSGNAPVTGVGDAAVATADDLAEALRHKIQKSELAPGEWLLPMVA